MKNILIGCEYSGTVREAFAKLGFNTWSCDLLPTDIPGQHFQCDVREVLDKGWDLAIFHPPVPIAGKSAAKPIKGSPTRSPTSTQKLYSKINKTATKLSYHERN